MVMETTGDLDEEQLVKMVRKLCASVRARVVASDPLEDIEAGAWSDLDAGRAVHDVRRAGAPTSTRRRCCSTARGTRRSAGSG